MAGIAEKFTSLLARPSDETAPPDGAPWYLKYGVRVLGIVAAFFAMLFGLWNCLSIIFFSVGCLVSGVLQIFAGFIVMAVEAPFCCMFLEHAQVIARKADERPMWNRAALYCIIAIPPVIFCPGLGSIFGCGLIFATGVVYGMMSIGKKASLEEMRNNAQSQNSSGGITTSDKASIVNNAQPFSFTGAVGTDSNV
ncbi:calcium channel flower isoform X2 [Condylostylus longicornis]|uniref:calcium channel flower isoform X2 n=1 Tax=Condylostylus longicornis TaxID=2530218 RepID=UPI00244DED5C|nr:calcium channel flower isoform X2 [Condylostylus longicornis]